MSDCYKNDLFIKTPLIESIVMKDFVEPNRIYLKLENTQPSGSFKLRGISRLCQHVSTQQYFREFQM
jgi:L-serine/L-threonine ammonia-lyase